MAGTSERSSAISDDRFRALVEDLPAVTYIADFVGTFTLRYISPQLEELFGYSPERWIADENAWVEAVHPDDRGRIVARDMMNLTLVCDHRILYGADAAQFLARIKALLEAPLRLAL